jgi:hypothetical protein
MTISSPTDRVAAVALRWLGPDEGGRAAPPIGPLYRPTAHFAQESLNESFSVVLELSATGANATNRSQQVGLRLLVPENLPEILQKLVPGQQLIITEGSRVVAIGNVLSVRGA